MSNLQSDICWDLRLYPRIKSRCYQARRRNVSKGCYWVDSSTSSSFLLLIKSCFSPYNHFRSSPITSQDTLSFRFIMALLTTNIVLSLVVIYVVYTVGLVLYRLYFSPLSRFPGPKLTAATLWYECNHDRIRRGKYTFEIAKMHENYGLLRFISDT